MRNVVPSCAGRNLREGTRSVKSSALFYDFATS
nr:MAG TPA: hypothetical protein [Caudoviricetes sp.]